MYYGKYRAIVRDTDDPEKRGRIRVECPAVLGKQLSAWALPNLPPNCFSVPLVGSMVWIEFEGGRKDSPIWTGVFYTTDQRKELFQEVYNPKDFIIRTHDGWVNIYSSRGILNQSGNNFLVKVSGEALVNNTEIALVGYPITGSTSSGASVTGTIQAK